MPQRYTLGPLAAPELVLTDTAQRGPWGFGAVDEFGVQWLCEYPKGWEDDDFQTPLDSVDGVDGALLGPQRLGPRQIGVSGKFIAPTGAAAVAAVKRLRRALPTRGPVTFAVTDEDDVRLWVPASPTGPVRAVRLDGPAVAFTFGLVAESPWRFGDALQSVSCGLPDSSGQAGFTPPLTLGSLVFAGSAPSGGSMTVFTGGDVSAWPVSVVDGPTLWPTARNRTTGQYVTFGTRLAAGSRLVADHRTGLVTVNGIQVPVPLVGYASALWSLAPGRNDIEFRSVDGFAPAARLTTSWYDTHR